MDAIVYLGPLLALLIVLIIIGIIYSLIVVIYRANKDYYNHGESRPPIFFRGFYKKAFNKEANQTQDSMDQAIQKLLEEESRK